MVLSIHSVEWPLVMAAFYGAPNDWLYRHCYKTYISIHHLRDADIHVINVKDIDSIVAMVPDTSYGITHHDGTEGNHWFLMENQG